MLYNNKKGFSLIELIVVIAIMAVLMTVLAPALLAYVEKSRMQRDDSAMSEVVNSVKLALANPDTYDEALEYAAHNNYLTYTDSSGVYGQRLKDEERWNPDGEGECLTITFTPDPNGAYNIPNAQINNMENSATAPVGAKQCRFEEMGNRYLYSAVNQTIGSSLQSKSATYRHSDYTVFVQFELVGGTRRPDVYGQWNGTNLSPASTPSAGTPSAGGSSGGSGIVGELELVPHVHTADCYESERVNICGLWEIEAHVHTADCYKSERVNLCGQAESETHSHTSDCYEDVSVLVCTVPDLEGHRHTSDCWMYVSNCICGHP